MFELTYTDAPVLVGLIALAMALVRIVERLLDALVRKRTNGKRSLIPAPAQGCQGLTPEEHAALMRLDESHAKTDKDGIPLWYVPRSMIDSMTKMVEIQDRTAVRLRDLVKAQDALNNKQKEFNEQQKELTDKIDSWEG